MIKGLLFDKDGTLFDFNKSWGAWARQFIDDFVPDQEKRLALANAFDFDYENAVFLPHSAIIAGTSQEIFQAIASVFPEMPADQIADAVIRSTRAAPMAPVCDLPSYFGALKADGYVLGIATNDSQGGAERQLEQFGILELFDYVAGADSGYGAKPGAGMCQGFLQTQNLSPEQAVMIGDSPYDIISGQAAGLLTVGVLTGTASVDDLAMADIVLPDITQIPDWLASNP